MKKYFDNTFEKHSALKWYTGKLLFKIVKTFKLYLGRNSEGIEDKENSNFDSHTF
jgi:hypothetical protein